MLMLALCQAISFVSQKMNHNHQLEMAEKIGGVVLKVSALAAGAHVAGKAIDNVKK